MGGEGPSADKLVKKWNILIFNLHVGPEYMSYVFLVVRELLL